MWYQIHEIKTLDKYFYNSWVLQILDNIYNGTMSNIEENFIKCLLTYILTFVYTFTSLALEQYRFELYESTYIQIFYK